MKALNLPLAAALVAVATLTACDPDRRSNRDSASASTVSAQRTAGLDASGLRDPRSGGGASVTEYAAQEVPIAQVKSSDTRLVALSAEEAKWLEVHHFPTADDIANAAALSTDELLRLARDKGDPKAAALLGDRHLRDGDLSGALAAYSLGESNGSLYSSEQLAVVMAARSAEVAPGPLPNDVRAVIVAGLEVAKMMGDHRAQILIDQYGKGLNRQFYGDAIQAQVAEYMRQMGESYKSRGMRAPGPDPRPNAHLWQQVDDGTAGPSVTVFQRSRKQ